ncbi:MAG: hypothetical protein ACRED0_12270 [Gammaproteobacteria bacterium]
MLAESYALGFNPEVTVTDAIVTFADFYGLAHRVSGSFASRSTYHRVSEDTYSYKTDGLFAFIAWLAGVSLLLLSVVETSNEPSPAYWKRRRPTRDAMSPDYVLMRLFGRPQGCWAD